MMTTKVKFLGLNEETAQTLEQYIKARERGYIKAVLALFQGHRERTAAKLGIRRSTLHAKMTEYGLMKVKSCRTKKLPT